MDFLYEHKQKHKKIFKIDTGNGYSEIYSPEQILKEIENESDLGKKILEDIENQQSVLNII